MSAEQIYNDLYWSTLEDGADFDPGHPDGPLAEFYHQEWRQEAQEKGYLDSESLTYKGKNRSVMALLGLAPWPKEKESEEMRREHYRQRVLLEDLAEDVDFEDLNWHEWRDVT